MQSTVIEVTPELAAEWLKKNIHNNRPISSAEKYAVDMKAGNWKLTHQGIAFDTNGTLIDGQNRLNAVIIAGVPVKMTVHFDCPEDSFEFLDLGRARTLSDVMKTQGYKNYTALSGVIGKVYSYESGSLAVLSNPGQGVYGINKITKTRSAEIEFFEQNKEALLKCVDFALIVYHRSASRLLSTSDIGLLYWVFGMGDDANEFIGKVCTGLDIQADTSAFLLRRVLEENKNRIRNISAKDLFKYWQAAWKKRNVPCKKLVINNGN